jgi:hypothetical protein
MGRFSLLMALIVGAIFVNFIEPQIRRRFVQGHHYLPEEHRSMGILRVAVGPAAAGALMGLMFELLHAGLSHDPSFFFRATVFHVLTCGSITYAWTVGVRHDPPRAAWGGALAGFVGALVVSVVEGFQVGSFTRLNPAWQELSRWLVLAEASRRILPTALLWAFNGFMGGLLIDQPWIRRWFRPGVVPAVSLLIIQVLVWIVALFDANSWAFSPHQIIYFLIMNGLVGGGWALGLLLYPRAEEALRVDPNAHVTWGWRLIAVVILLLLTGGRVYLWLPQTSTPFFEEEFLSSANWDGGACKLALGTDHLIVSAPLGPCQIRLQKPPRFGPPIVIDLWVSTHLGEGRSYALQYLDESHGRLYSLHIFEQRAQLVLVENGQSRVFWPGTGVSHTPARIARNVRLEIRRTFVRGYLDNFALGFWRARDDTGTSGGVLVALSAGTEIELHDVYVGVPLDSLWPL